MIDSLLKAKQVTFANLELGFHPAIVRAKELIKSNAIGLLQRVTISLYAKWRCKENFDLCLMNRMSCWYIDVMNRIINSIPNRVMVFDGYGGLGRMQPVSTAVYDYNGIWGVFSASIARSEGVSITIEITGTNNANCGNSKNVAQLNLIGLATEESKDTGNWANIKIL